MTVAEDILAIFDKQKAFANKNRPSYTVRIANLKKLKTAILQYEDEIFEALYLDLHKSHFESYATEIGFVLKEIGYHIKKLKKWMKPKRVSTPITNFPAKSYLTHEPKGKVLIISPWNYPFQLLIAPLVGAISAGNTAILKPSEISSHTAEVLKRMINNTFAEQYLYVLSGGVEISQLLLKLKFDHIFFTGSPRTGKIVMQEVAKNMVPVTLELGGKSPCIVDENTNIKLTARRIVWGKLLNAGQTCIAPDYLLVHSGVKSRLLSALAQAIKIAYGDDARHSPDYPRIISRYNIERLSTLIKDANIYYGGKFDADERYFEPTILNNVDFDMPVMQQEIFGPILPVITFTSYDEIVAKINNRPKPLALYVFTNDRKLQNHLIDSIPAGGACINDTIMQIANSKLPFGGIGNSGTGNYHGKYSFETFSHAKAIVKKTNRIDVSIRYAPFGNKLKIVKILMH